jgi:hypothetical protein
MERPDSGRLNEGLLQPGFVQPNNLEFEVLEGACTEGRLPENGAEKAVSCNKGDFLLKIADLEPHVGFGIPENAKLATPGQRLAFRIHLYNYRMGKSENMTEDLLDFVVKKKEEHYVEKFKNQTALMKKFGEEGIKVYVVLDEKKSMGQMLQESGVGEDKFIDILEFMDMEGMITLEHVMPETIFLKPPVHKDETEAFAPSAPVAPPLQMKPASTGIQITPQIEPDDAGRQFIPKEPAKALPVPGINRDEHTSTPLPTEYQNERVLSPKEATGPERPRSQIEIMHAGDELERREVEPPKPEDLLSPLERVIFEKFGKEGVSVYNLIDGEKTAEQILTETGVTESRLVEILEFMDDEGIIKLEKPGKRGPQSPSMPTANEQKQQFEPMVDREGAIDDAPPGKDKEKTVPITLPKPMPLGIFGKLETNLKLSLRYRGTGQKLFSALDGKKDVVELSRELSIPLEEMDHILATLAKRKAITTSQLSDEQVKEKYGADGLRIFSRYGRDGVLIYELIGKEKSIRDVVLRSKVEPKRAVEIVLFIHKVLGLGLPIDTRVLYSQLGVKG